MKETLHYLYADGFPVSGDHARLDVLLNQLPGTHMLLWGWVKLTVDTIHHVQQAIR